jgi:CRISPR-associated protein Csb1
MVFMGRLLQLLVSTAVVGKTALLVYPPSEREVFARVQEGMKHALASRTVGGVVVKGEIKRVVRLNLVALRNLRAYKDGTVNENLTRGLQKYMLGLALVAASQPLEHNLREGCLLCPDEEKGASSKLVKKDGTEEEYSIDPGQAENYAEAAAQVFFGDDYENKDMT